ncbi:MAG TPA: hypothetical protein VGH29_05355, partial [Candidatus Binataceae bacterium]
TAAQERDTKPQQGYSNIFPQLHKPLRSNREMQAGPHSSPVNGPGNSAGLSTSNLGVVYP